MRLSRANRVGSAIGGVCLSLSFAPNVAAESAFRVKDINGVSSSSNPTDLTSVGGGLAEGPTLFFAAPDGVHGSELWKSDGTSSGTVLVKDIRNGSLGSSPAYLTNVSGSFFAAGRLYFAADDGVAGVELWRSDGTAAGTVMVKDINLGPVSSQPANLTAVSTGGMFGGSRLFFTADDGSGVELWTSDGTSAGTQRVKDINTGPFSSLPVNLTAVGTVLFFTADDGDTGRELWKSDGTEGGTVRVKDIYPGTTASIPVSLTSFGDTLFFFASAPGSGREPWKSDGTEGGTVMVKEIWPGNGGSPDRAVVVGGFVFFKADDNVNGAELWRSDGTAAGTVMVADINPSGDAMAQTPRMARVGSRLFFTADDGVHGWELWRSDGTAAGTVLVKDIFPGPTGGEFNEIVEVNGIAYLRAEDSASDSELWRSDGRPEGTFRVHDVHVGLEGSDPHQMTVSGRFLFFAAYSADGGGELWATDLVFKDGFESGGAGAWSSASVDGGDLFVHPSAALDGSQGLAAFVDDTASLYVVDEAPNNEGRYRARFRFDPNGFDPGLANGALRVRLFIAFEEDPNTRLVTLVLRRVGSQFSVMARVRLDDGTRAQTPFFNITDAPHMVEVDWVASQDPDANDGSFTIYVDETPRGTLTDLDNSGGRVDFARLGAITVKVGANGTLLYDDFESRRERYIGSWLP